MCTSNWQFVPSSRLNRLPARPSNWYHFVENLDNFVISINHNWCNATNLPSMYRSMCEEVADTEEALSDVKQMIYDNPNRKEGDDPLQEWIATVQDVVEKNAGWR